MKISRFGIATIVMFIVGIAIFAQSLIQHEERKRTRDLRHKGNYLVSLIALHPMEDFHTDKRDFIVKTLAEYVTSEGLVYCIVHDQTGAPLLSLAHREVVDQIPPDVKQRSLYVNGLVHQTFKMNGTDNLINEFAKPIYQDGHKSGTVRMGFDLPPITIFSPGLAKK